MSKNKDKKANVKGLRSLLYNNKFVLLLSVILAFGIWIWVSIEKSPEVEVTISSVPVKIDMDNSVPAQLNLQIFGDNNYTVDVTKPRGEKVNILSMADGTPFDMDKRYKVALNSYRGNGGGDLLTIGAVIAKEDLSERIVFATDKDLRYYLMQYIEQQKSLHPHAMHQWKFIPEEWTVPAAKRDYKLLFGEDKE